LKLIIGSLSRYLTPVLNVKLVNTNGDGDGVSDTVGVEEIDIEGVLLIEILGVGDIDILGVEEIEIEGVELTPGVCETEILGVSKH